jgi:DNA-binding response OmpR family regulator
MGQTSAGNSLEMKALSESGAVQISADAARASGKGVKRVLLAWDDPLARRILADKLRGTGFEVEEAGDATIALKKLHSTHPHAVFLQFSLQGSQGVEFVKEARRDTKFAERPIYVCTVCSSLSTWTRRTANAGPTKFFNMLATPVDMIVAKVMADVLRADAPAPAEEAEELEFPCVVSPRVVPDELKRNIANLIRDLGVIVALSDREMRVSKCAELRRAAHSVMSCGAVAGLIAMSRVAAAVENLLKTLCASPASINEGSLSSIGGALQVVSELCSMALSPEAESAFLTASVLTDEARIRAAACNALIGAGFDTTSFADPDKLLESLTTNPTNLIVLGYNTGKPSMVEIGSSIRALPLQERTPIILIADAAGSAVAGLEAVPGAETMVQPFSFAEVAVRALTLSYRLQLSEFTHTTSEICRVPFSSPVRDAEVQSEPALPAASFTMEETKEEVMKMPEAVLEEVVLNSRPGKAPAATDPAARCRQLEEELSGMGNLCGELLGKYTAEQQTAAELAQRGADLETQLSSSQLELAKARAELEATVAERQRLETENRVLQESKEAAAKEAAAALAKAREAEALEPQARPDDSLSIRTRITADLERERAERRRVEQRTTTLATQLQEMHARTGQHLESERLSQERILELERQLQEREESLARATSDLEKESAERQTVEDQLRAAEGLIAQLQNSVASFDTAKKAMQRRHDDLDKQLKASVAAAAESNARAARDAGERERLEKALSVAELSAQEHGGEVSKLQCALEVEQAERNRLEGELAQLRYSSADTARTGLATLNRLRSETRTPVTNLMQATRQLLEVDLPEEAKALVTTVLDNALLVQTKLQETGSNRTLTPSPEPAAKGDSPSASPSPAVEVPQKG